MSAPLLKLAVLVAMTHGIRVLGRLAGPRRSSLVLGLPSTTAVALVGCGLERGLDAAAGMAEASLLGLVAAVAVPLIYAGALGLGWRLPGALATAVAGFALVAGGLGCLPAHGPTSGFGLAALAVLAACHVAGRIPTAGDAAGRSELPRSRTLALRTAVPVASLAIILALQDTAGPYWAGLLGPFPGLTLTVLVTTHLEAGPAEAGRLAAAVPAGNLGMVAFLAAFRLSCPSVGLGWGTAGGYATALAVLLVVHRLDWWVGPGVGEWTCADRRRDTARVWSVWRVVLASSILVGRAGLLGPSRRPPVPKGRFSPLVEPIVL
jgi:hypothetical protein